MVYDERNPALGPEAAAGRQWAMVCERAEAEGAVRRVGKQRVTEKMKGKLKYLAEGLKEKYGMEAER